MGRILLAVLLLMVLGLAGLTGYAYLADLEPERRDARIPVTITLD